MITTDRVEELHLVVKSMIESRTQHTQSVATGSYEYLEMVFEPYEILYSVKIGLAYENYSHPEKFSFVCVRSRTWSLKLIMSHNKEWKFALLWSAAAINIITSNFNSRI